MIFISTSYTSPSSVTKCYAYIVTNCCNKTQHSKPQLMNKQ